MGASYVQIADGAVSSCIYPLILYSAETQTCPFKTLYSNEQRAPHHAHGAVDSSINQADNPRPSACRVRQALGRNTKPSTSLKEPGPQELIVRYSAVVLKDPLDC